jgi:hypothetical protein
MPKPWAIWTKFVTSFWSCCGTSSPSSSSSTLNHQPGFPLSSTDQASLWTKTDEKCQEDEVMVLRDISNPITQSRRQSHTQKKNSVTTAELLAALPPALTNSYTAQQHLGAVAVADESSPRPPSTTTTSSTSTSSKSGISLNLIPKSLLPPRVSSAATLTSPMTAGTIVLDTTGVDNIGGLGAEKVVPDADVSFEMVKASDLVIEVSYITFVFFMLSVPCFYSFQLAPLFFFLFSRNKKLIYINLSII